MLKAFYLYISNYLPDPLGFAGGSLLCFGGLSFLAVPPFLDGLGVAIIGIGGAVGGMVVKIAGEWLKLFAKDSYVHMKTKFLNKRKEDEEQELNEEDEEFWDWENRGETCPNDKCGNKHCGDNPKQCEKCCKWFCTLCSKSVQGLYAQSWLENVHELKCQF
jgi:hypothetical protein